MTAIDLIADQVLPLDATGPEQVAAAASIVAELVRRLNHATSSATAAPALPTPQAADQVVSALADAVERMPQLCGQLADLMDRLAAKPGLTADGLGPTPPEGAPGIARAAGYSLRCAQMRLAAVASDLRIAGRSTARLYLGQDGD
jgi:hypothetical protein